MKNLKAYIKIIIYASILVISIFTPAPAQTINFPLEPVVIYYGCDHTSLTADTVAPEVDSSLNTASYYIYRDITKDNQTQQIIFVANESADTAAADTARDVFTVPPDSIIDSEYQTGYLLGSTVTGIPGNYTLTVYIKDAYTKKVFASGTAAFASITPENIRNACSAAVVDILPIITKIQNYQLQLRSQNPFLSIDPQLTVNVDKTLLNYGESTNITITATDYDGKPLANMVVKLSSEGDGGGSFSVDSLRTGADGIAKSVFTAGGQDGTIILTARISNIPLVNHDTTSASDGEIILLGKGSPNIPWWVSFKFKEIEITLKDGATYSSSGFSSSRYVSVTTAGASGRLLLVGSLNVRDPFQIDLSSPDFAYGGFVKGNYKSLTKSNGISVSIGDNGTVCISRTTVDRKEEGNTNNLLDFSLNAFVQPPDTEMGFGFVTPDYYKDREAQKAIGFCSEGNYLDTVNTFGLPGGGSLLPPEGKVQQYVSFDSVKYSYSLTRDTSLSQYSVKVDLNGTHVAYESNLSDTTIMYTAVFKPVSYITGLGIKKYLTPLTFALSQNYPNPFNPSTIINYQIPKQSHVVLKVYNILGSQVAVLVNEDKSPGRYSVNFNASKLSSGVYFYRIEAGSFVQTKKLILLK